MEVEVEAEDRYFLFRDLLELLFWTFSVDAVVVADSGLSSTSVTSMHELDKLDALSLDALSFVKAFWISSTRVFVFLLTHWLNAQCEPNLLNDFPGRRQNWLLPSKLNSTYSIKVEKIVSTRPPQDNQLFPILLKFITVFEDRTSVSV